jgi:hypothetical protein
MLTALILICSVQATPDIRSCNRENAVDAMQVPESFASPATCFMRGQAYLADTSLGRDLTENERVKVMCVRSASAPLPTLVGAARTAPAQSR